MGDNKKPIVIEKRGNPNHFYYEVDGRGTFEVHAEKFDENYLITSSFMGILSPRKIGIYNVEGTDKIAYLEAKKIVNKMNEEYTKLGRLAKIIDKTPWADQLDLFGDKE